MPGGPGRPGVVYAPAGPRARRAFACCLFVALLLPRLTEALLLVLGVGGGDGAPARRQVAVVAEAVIGSSRLIVLYLPRPSCLRRLLARVRLPTANGDIGVARVDLKAKAATARPLAGDEGAARSQEAVEDDVA